MHSARLRELMAATLRRQAMRDVVMMADSAT
jgi:hypothetical protein